MNAKSVHRAWIGAGFLGLLTVGTANLCAATTPAEAWFDRIKGLAGTWEGKAQHGDGDLFPVTISYRITAGGATVEETLFGGTSHEMITMYHMNGSQLMLTHYCAQGNQPRMRAVQLEDPKVLHFDFLDGTNMSWEKDGHMHSAVITFDGPDHLQSAWTFWQNGQPGAAAKFDVMRKKTS